MRILRDSGLRSLTLILVTLWAVPMTFAGCKTKQKVEQKTMLDSSAVVRTSTGMDSSLMSGHRTDLSQEVTIRHYLPVMDSDGNLRGTYLADETIHRTKVAVRDTQSVHKMQVAETEEQIQQRRKDEVYKSIEKKSGYPWPLKIIVMAAFAFVGIWVIRLFRIRN